MTYGEPPAKLEKLPLALLKAQREMMETAVTKAATNPHFKSSYADLSSVIDAVIPILNRNGITVIQIPTVPPFPDNLALTTTLLHESGENISGTLVIPLEKANAQGVGSAITYGRRYSLASILGLKQEDDDGEGAVDHKSEAKLQPPKQGAPVSKPTWGSVGATQQKATPPVRGKAKLFPSVNEEEGQ